MVSGGFIHGSIAGIATNGAASWSKLGASDTAKTKPSVPALEWFE
jgi:hypothetical protein